MNPELIIFVRIFLIYTIVVIVIPTLILKRIVPSICGVKRFFMSFLLGNFIIINLVYLLAFLKIYYFYTLMGAYIICYMSIFILGSHTKALRQFGKVKKCLSQLRTGCLKPKQLLWEFGRNQKKIFLERGVRNWKVNLLLVTEGLIVTFIIIGMLCVLGYRVMYLKSFAAPDEEVHLQWIQSLLNNQVFHSGIYPFGMHNIMSALSYFSGVHIIDILAFGGLVTNFWSFLIQYMIIRSFCKNPLAPIVALATALSTGIFSSEMLERMQFTVPHEMAIPFFLCMGCFLIWFLKEKDKKDLIFFAMGFSLTILTHFHVTIVAGIFCLCIGALFLVYALKQKIVVKILIAGTVAVLVGVVPIGIGLVTGHPFEQSMAWAVSVIKGQDNLSEKEEKEKNEIKELEEKLSISIDEKNELEELPFYQQLLIEFSQHSYSTQEVTKRIILVFAIGVALFIVNASKKKRSFWEAGRGAWIVFSGVVLILMVSEVLGIPVLLYPTRLSSYLIFVTMFIVSSPLEELYSLVSTRRWWKVLMIVLTGGVLITGGIKDYQDKFFISSPTFFYFQTTGARMAVSSIIQNYPQNTWTVVSVVTETSMVYRDGYHYEWIDFLEELEDKEEIIIPTKYVFFIVEKTPIVAFGDSFHREDILLKERPSIERSDAYVELKEEKSREDYYKYQREIVMAKADLWVELFSKQYPSEMETYYEDEEVVVYRLEQNGAYNNLSIDEKGVWY